MSSRTSQGESVGLDELLRYKYFPTIAEIDEDNRSLSNTSSQTKFQQGDLLWLLRYGADEETGDRAVRVCRFDAPNLEFPVRIDDSIKVYHRDYADVRYRLANTKGPLMELSELANLVKDSEKPVFAVRDGSSKKNERILIHSKPSQVVGYLAKGKRHSLIIPENFDGLFGEKLLTPSEPKKFKKLLDIVKEKWPGEIHVVFCTSTKYPLEDKLYPGDIFKFSGYTNDKMVTLKRLKSKEGKLGEIQVSSLCQGSFEATTTTTSHDGAPLLYQDMFTLKDYFKDYKGDFPVEVSCAGTNTDSYLMSLENETLQQESSLKVLGRCTYSSVYTSIQESDPTSTPFYSARTYPAYTSMKVRAASSVPVHVHVVRNFTKPRDVVQVLSQKEFEVLEKSMESKPTGTSDWTTRKKKISEPGRSRLLEEELGPFSPGTEQNGPSRRERASTFNARQSDQRGRSRTFAGVRATVLFKDKGEIDQQSKTARMSNTGASAAAFLKKKHEEKKKKISTQESSLLLSKELYGSLPDISHLKTIQNRPVPLPPSTLMSNNNSGSVPDLREKGRIENRPLPQLPLISTSDEISGSLPDLREDESQSLSSKNHLRPPPPPRCNQGTGSRLHGRRTSSLSDLPTDFDSSGSNIDEDEYVDMRQLRAQIKLDLLCRTPPTTDST